MKRCLVHPRHDCTCAEFERLKTLNVERLKALDDCAIQVDRLRTALREIIEMCDPRETRQLHIGLRAQQGLGAEVKTIQWRGE